MNDLRQYFQENFTEEPDPEPAFKLGQEVYFIDDFGAATFGWIERIEKGLFGPLYHIHKIERRSNLIFIRSHIYVKEVTPNARLNL